MGKRDASSSSDSSSDSGSDSDSSSSEEEVQEAKKQKTEPTKLKETSSSGSDSSSSSDSDSDDEKPAAAAPAPAAAAKADSSGSDSSSSSDSDSDSDDEKPAAAAPAPAAKAADSDDDSSSSSSSSGSDSDSSDDEKEAPISKKRALDADVKEEPEAKKPKAEAPADGNGESSEVFVGGLPWKVTEDELKEFFGVCGTITAVSQPTDDQGRSKGIAYVKFTDSAAAAKAVAKNEEELGGRWLKIELSTGPKRDARPAPVKPDQPCYTIFMGNISWDADEAAVRAAFDSCGTITAVRFATDRNTGEFRGFGHVEFEEETAAEKAVAVAGTMVSGRPIRVDYSMPREKKEAKAW